MQFLPFIMMAVSAVGALSKAQQQSQQFKAAAAANDYNAAVQRQRAESAAQVYGQREEAQRRSARMMEGKQAAAIAQSGVGTGGSNLDVQSQSEVLAELDALNIRYEGTLQQQGLLAGADLDTFYAGQNRKSASAATRGGILGAAGAILGGTGDYIKLSDAGRAGGRGLNSNGPAPSIYGLYGNYGAYG